ncbi:hypothetical protein SmJEL517_g00760 [Synchytrium microbalum]|uniref:GAT domain-containing protein n=1 Tax=Synchytrium microbalum TaxID=1806994 RepID=A0A507CID7_9FUNG|nr:uncharacterized protein SmJEL517_g00760 [Synchytrium microbalum]TPX37465.1 hypothetical protein SmJEL517_g00760 [Synchytrium microbalum]
MAELAETGRNRTMEPSSADDTNTSLLLMGFDNEQSASAVRTALARIAQDPTISLLEAALQYLLAITGDEQEPRAVLCTLNTCSTSGLGQAQSATLNHPKAQTTDTLLQSIIDSPPHSPKANRPPPCSAVPAKSILKPSNSPPAIRSTTGSIFKRDWLVKQVDTAASVLTATLGRIRTGTVAINTNATSTPTSNTNNGQSWTSMFGSPPATSSPMDQSWKTATNGHANGSVNGYATMPHLTPTTSLSNASLSPATPPDLQRSRENSDPNIGGDHPSSLAKIPRHVRFSFPDITISPEEQPIDEMVFYSEEADNQGTNGSSSSNMPLTVNSTDSLARRQAGSSRNVDHSVVSGTRMRDHTNRYDADELLLFYQQAAARRGEPTLDKLTNQLSISGFLTKLDLSGSMLDRKNIASISELLTEVVGLTQLNMANCNLEDDSLKMLLHAILYRNELPWLSLADNRRLRGNGIKYIAVFIKKTKSLKYLDMSGLAVDRKGLAYLNHALSPSDSQPLGPTIEGLKLENCRLRGNMLDTIVPGVRRSRLTHLSLKDNKATWEAGQPISEMLLPDDDQPEAGMPMSPKRQGLTSIDLRGNDLRNGIAPICAALNDNDRLRELDLRDNKIDGPGLDIIASLLRKNTGLRVLDLSGNAFGTDMEGITSLKEAMTQNRDLLELYLANTRIGTEGAIALAEALPLCDNLKRLDVTYNPIDLAGVMALAISLRMNDSLVSLEIVPVLDRPGVKPEEASELNRMLHDIFEHTGRNMEMLAKSRSSVSKNGDLDTEENMNDSPPRSHTVGTPPRTRHSHVRKVTVDPLQLGKEIATGEETAGLLIDMIKSYSADRTSELLISQDELMRQLYVECQRIQDRLHSVFNNVVDDALIGQLLSVNERLLEAMRLYETEVGVKSPKSPRRPHNKPQYQQPQQEQSQSQPQRMTDDGIAIPARSTSALPDSTAEPSEQSEQQQPEDDDDASSVISEALSDSSDSGIGKVALEQTFSDAEFFSESSTAHLRSPSVAAEMSQIDQFLKENS